MSLMLKIQETRLKRWKVPSLPINLHLLLRERQSLAQIKAQVLNKPTLPLPPHPHSHCFKSSIISKSSHHVL